jgi:CheY-like chemotaxis protein
VVLATGYGPSLSNERARQLGIVAVLRKPLTAAELIEALHTATGKRVEPHG